MPIVTIALSVSETAATFDELAFRQGLARVMAGISANEIRLVLTEMEIASNATRRRALAGTVTGATILRVDVVVNAWNQMVADHGASTLRGLVEDYRLSEAIGVSVQVLEPPTTTLSFTQAPLPPPMPPERPISEWSLEYGTRPGALLIKGNGTHDTVVEISDVLFNGFDSQHGGALAVLEGGVAFIRNSTFTNNEARYGGALYVRGGKVTLDRCRLEGNTATRGGGAVYVASGSVLLGNGTTLRDNHAPAGKQISFLAGEILYYLPAASALPVCGSNRNPCATSIILDDC